MGYEWHAVFRQTPENGSEVVLDTHEAFSDLSGPERLQISYDPDQRRSVDVNRAIRTFTFGFRLRVRMLVWIDTMQDSQHLFDVTNRLARTDWTTELSLNGSDSYYEVALRDFRGPDALRNKTIAGADFLLDLEAVELLDEIPYLTDLVVPVPTAGGYALPTAAAGYKWVIWTVEGGTGNSDVTYQCVRNSGGGWEWVPFVSGS